MRRKFIALLSIVLAISMTGCGNSNSGENANQSDKASAEQDASPIESLNEDERAIYNCLIENINSFYNPQAVKLLEIRVPSDEYFDVLKIVDDVVGGSSSRNRLFIQINSTNKLGGNVSSIFEFDLDASTYSDLGKNEYCDRYWSEASTQSDKYGDSAVSNINKALSYYWEEQGI